MVFDWISTFQDALDSACPSQLNVTSSLISENLEHL